MNHILIVALVSAFLFPSFAADSGQQELTGVLAKGQKALCANVLRLDGATGSMDLKADSLLKNIPDGARIWVKGDIRTELFDSSKLDSNDQCAMPTHWHIFMVAKECKIIEKPFQRPKEKQVQNQPSEGTH